MKIKNGVENMKRILIGIFIILSIVLGASVTAVADETSKSGTKERAHICEMKIFKGVHNFSEEEVAHDFEADNKWEKKYGDKCYELRIYRDYIMKCTICGEEETRTLLTNIVHTHPKCPHVGIEECISQDQWYNERVVFEDKDTESEGAELDSARGPGETACCSNCDRKLFKISRKKFLGATTCNWSQDGGLWIKFYFTYFRKCEGCGKFGETESRPYAFIHTDPECEKHGISYPAADENWYGEPISVIDIPGGHIE